MKLVLVAFCILALAFATCDAFMVGPRGSKFLPPKPDAVHAVPGRELYGEMLPGTFDLMESMQERDRSIRALMAHASSIELFNQGSMTEKEIEAQTGATRSSLISEYVTAAESLGHSIPENLAEMFLFPKPAETPRQ